MASTALAVIAICLIFGGRFPVAGGRVLRGGKPRLLGALTLPFGIGGVFVPGGLGLLVAGIPLAILSAVYFLAKGEEPTPDEARWLPFASPPDKEKTFLQTLASLAIFFLVLTAMVAVIGVVLRLTLRL